jgi:hypothetical protein
MKNILSFFFFTLVLQVYAGLTAQAQNLDYTRVGLMKADYDHRALVYLSGSRSMATAALGAPTSVTTEFSELDDKNTEVWQYNASKLYFVDDVLVAYELRDATLAMGQSYSTSLTVGSPMPTRQIRVPDTDGGVRGGYHYEEVESLPGYALSARTGKSRNLTYAVMGLAYLQSGTTSVDGFSEVLFNSSRRVLNIYVKQ